MIVRRYLTGLFRTGAGGTLLAPAVTGWLPSGRLRGRRSRRRGAGPGAAP